MEIQSEMREDSFSSEFSSMSPETSLETVIEDGSSCSYVDNEITLTQPSEYKKNTESSNTTFIQSNFRKNKNTEVKSRKRKKEPLEELINTCSNIGGEIQNLMSNTTENIEPEDYHFCLSLAQSMKHIPNKEKLLLKAKFLSLVAEASS